MALNYKVMPLPKHRLEEMRKNSLYNEMMDIYGEENMINNYLVDVVILQEERAIYVESGEKIDVTRELIRNIYNNSQSIYEKWLEAPINKLKSKRTEDINCLGAIPVILNHEEKMEVKHGLLVSGSLKLVNIDDKLHLLGKIVLISPESKFNWLQGNWSSISPGLLNQKIREISFVTVSAQMNSMTLSSGEVEKTMIANDSIIDELDNKLNLSKARHEQKIFDEKLKRKESDARWLTEQLINDGIIGTNKRKTMQRELLNLSSGESRQVVNLIQKIGVRGSLHNKPKMVLIRGDHEVNKKERFAKFQTDNSKNFKSHRDLLDEFHRIDIEYEKALNLSAGKGEIEPVIDNKDTAKNYLRELADSERGLDDEEKNHVKKLYAKLNLSDGENEDVTMESGEISAGGEVHPDSTNLSDGNSEVDYVKSLESSYAELKKHYTEVKADLEKHKTCLYTIKNSIGD